MAQRRVFYSFHYKADSWRASKVRNIGKVSGNSPATDNAWETITRGAAAAIRRWIDAQMRGRSCVIVLVGAQTFKRKWIHYEIDQALRKRKGLLGVHVNKLKDGRGMTSAKGPNPFRQHSINGRPLSSLVNCYSPAGSSSGAAYRDIAWNIEDWIEKAIEARSMI